MLKLELGNLHQIDPKHGVSPAELEGNGQHLSDFLKQIDGRGQGFYQVIDEAPLEAIRAYKQNIQDQYDDIVVLGIGGSALGTLCLQQSLTHLFSHRLPHLVPRLHVLDNIDPALIRELEDAIEYDRTLFIVVTKSGGTPETLSQFFYYRAQAEARGLDWRNHFAFITDPKKGLLRQIGESENIPMFDIPPNVGGRFSVLTAVGLLPAELIGLDTDALIAGAQAMRDRFLSKTFAENLPFQLATVQYLAGQKGKPIHVLMPYSQRLIRLADWYRQLLAESIGKRLNDAGETVNVGLTPVNALGATDQHSQSQLYNEGPNDKLLMFIEVTDLGPDVPIPMLYPNDENVAFLKGVTFNQLLNTEKGGTAAAFNENDRPNLTIKIDRVDAEHLGQLFLLFEGATAFLGEFYGIDAFDQPGVERSKILTKQLLSQ